MKGYATTRKAVAGIEIREAPEPKPTENEALVAVRAFSVNRGELRLIGKRPDGWSPGQDVSGVVVREARDGSSPPAGTRVCGLAENAGWSQLAVVPGRRLATLPYNVPFVEAAALPIAGTTALRLVDLGGSLLGERVLVTGAAGGVGTMAVQLASLAGASVTAVVHGPKRADGLSDIGASSVVYDPAEATGPFKLILESVGGASLQTALRKIGPMGSIVSFGNSSDSPAELEFESLSHANGASIRFFFNYQTTDAILGDTLQRVVDLVASSRLHVRVGYEGDWKNAPEALVELEERRIAGKAVLTVAE